MKFENLQDAELDFLTRAWVRADGAIHQRFGKPLEKDRSNLDLLQEVLDSEAVQEWENWDVPPYVFGVALGRILIHTVHGLDWAVADDEYGRDVVLRLENTSLVVNAIGMINKRAKRKEHIDLQGLYSAARDHVNRMRGTVD